MLGYENSTIVKVMKKSETKAENQKQEDLEDGEHRTDIHQVFKRNTYDRHLIEVGCDTFTQLFARYPMMDYISEYDHLEVEGVCIGEALR